MARMQRTVPKGWHEVPVLVLAFAAVGSLAIPYPEILGNGKAASQVAFAGAVGFGAAAALVLLKPAATALCLRAGARGGLLTPAFATGALLGVALGRVWSQFWPGSPPAAYAVIGAAAVLASAQRAPVTALLLTEEFTHADLAMAVPTIIAVGLSLGASTLVSRLGVGLAVRLRANHDRGSRPHLGVGEPEESGQGEPRGHERI
jgi:H+/Cl- antiporter ClcA